MSLRPVSIAIAVLCTLPAAALAQQSVASGQPVQSTNQQIEIYDAVGTVTLRHGAGSAVVITPTAQGADGSQLRFETDERGGRFRLRVIFPDVDAIASPGMGGNTTLTLRGDGTFGGDDHWGGRTRIGGSRGLHAFANIEVTVPDNREVNVHVAVGKAEAQGVNGTVTLDTWSADAEVSDVSGEWLLDTGSGDAKVTGFRAGSIKLDTGSGAGIARDVSGDLLDIDTGSGDADATNVTVARFRFDTGSGSVRAGNVKAARGTVDTGSGSVDLSYADGPIDDLSVDTGSGPVVLALPRNPDVRIAIDSNQRGVQIDRDGAIYDRRGSEDDGPVLRFGDGHGRVKIDTGSGRVTIR